MYKHLSEIDETKKKYIRNNPEATELSWIQQLKTHHHHQFDQTLKAKIRKKDSERERESRMKLSPIILSAAVAASGQYLQTASGSRRLDRPANNHQQRHQHHQPAELSTEYFLVPAVDRVKQQQEPASTASVVSVPASGTRGHQRPGPAIVNSGDDPRIGPAPHQPLLRQQSWALPLAALSAVAMLIMAGFEVFVLLKVRRVVFLFLSDRYAGYGFFCSVDFDPVNLVCTR